MRNAAINKLTEIAENDHRICLMTGDLGYGVLDAYSTKCPERFFNIGISEQFMASAAAGMAMSGKIVFTYSIGNFSTLRCIEQIRNDICYHNANVKILSVGSGFSYGQLGMSHYATEDIAMLRSLPNMKILTPCDLEESVAVISYTIKSDGPCYIRFGKKSEPSLYGKSPDFDVAKIHCVKKGRDVAILSHGTILNCCIQASEELSKLKISTGVYAVSCIKPLDIDAIREIACHYGYIVTVEEHSIIGGLGSAVADILSELALPHSQLYRIGLKDSYTNVIGDYTYLCDYYGLSGDKITEKILGILR